MDLFSSFAQYCQGLVLKMLGRECTGRTGTLPLGDGARAILQGGLPFGCSTPYFVHLYKLPGSLPTTSFLTKQSVTGTPSASCGWQREQPPELRPRLFGRWGPEQTDSDERAHQFRPCPLQIFSFDF